MIIYNGATGGLGRFFSAAATGAGVEAHAISARLEDLDGFSRELRMILTQSSSKEITFVLMAAMVSVPECEKNPERAHKTNVVDTVATAERFLNDAKAAGFSPKIIYVSTGHVYAAQAWGHRISETDSVAPRSVYARTKLQAESELASLMKHEKVPLLITRVFGLIAPGQPPHYVLPGLIQRAREGQLAGVPGLDYARDYLDARDVCRDLVELAGLEAGKWERLPGQTLNICSGRIIKIRDLADAVCAAVGADKAALSPAPGRADDVPWMIGDPSRIKSLLGREPYVLGFSDTVRDTISG